MLASLGQRKMACEEEMSGRYTPPTYEDKNIALGKQVV
jgi:hypothetical protein